MTGLQIKPVVSPADLRAFVAFPRRLHRSDPRFMPQLDQSILDLLDNKKSPVMRDNASAAWLALADGQVVGRILAIKNETHLAVHKDGAGHFGFLDAVDDQAVFDLLLATAEGWLREQGLTKAVGPFSPSINYESGLEIEAQGEPPVYGMNYAPPYYGARVEACGYGKLIDLYSFSFGTDVMALRPELGALAAKGTESGLTIRMLRPKNYRADIELLIDIYNDGWARNWGAIPMGMDEAHMLGSELRALYRPEWVQFVEKDGKPVAAAMQMPDLNEATRDLDGKLFPLGWLKLLWRMKRPAVHNSRLVLLGVRRAWHNSALAPIAALMLIDSGLAHARRFGLTRAEVGWILETNKPMLAIVGKFPGMKRKIYRIFEKSL